MENSRVLRISLLASLIILACAVLVNTALTQDIENDNGSGASQQGPKPKFVTLPPRYLENLQPPATATVTNWSGSFVSGGHTYPYTMVGTDPSSTDTTTTVTAYIIPVRVGCHGHVYDPKHVLPNGRTVIANTTASPIFNSGIDFVQSGTDLGNTQYEDAFQRGNFWGDVVTNTSYHLLLNVQVLPEQSLRVPTRDCSIGNPFGFGNVAIVNINYFDAQLQSIISKSTTITPSSFPIALTYDLYLSENSGLSGCCIGGYHSDFGSLSAPQTYAQFTYIPNTGQFSQDVSALSHEAGEWVDDPFVDNSTPVMGGCDGILEVGDPLENEPNFGTYPYNLGGFTYHLQDLVFLDFFSGNNSLQVNGWWTFQNELSGQCS
ncbi:MAG: hypothetical protein ACRD3T_03430 [Terriglobia bacterium]